MEITDDHIIRTELAFHSSLSSEVANVISQRKGRVDDEKHHKQAYCN